LTGVGDVLLSNLESGAWKGIMRELRRIFKKRYDVPIFISPQWIYAVPIVEVWGMELHEIPSIVELVEKEILRPSIYAEDIMGRPSYFLAHLTARSPTFLLFSEPIPWSFTGVKVGHRPVIFYPFDISSIGMQLLEEKKPAVGLIPLDFTRLEQNMEILEKAFPTGLEVVNGLFKSRPDIYDLLMKLGTIYEEGELNPIIILMPYQNIANRRIDKTIEDLALSLLHSLSTILPALNSWDNKIDKTALLVLAGSKLFEKQRKGEIKVKLNAKRTPFLGMSSTIAPQSAIVDLIFEILNSIKEKQG